MAELPILHVEGKDDISVISSLLARHGIETDRGAKHLLIRDQGSVDKVLDAIPLGVRASTERPIGFVVDIDVDLAGRWQAVCDRLRPEGISPPSTCPIDGYIDQIQDYPVEFGIWLMPDCQTNLGKLEHLIESLIPEGNVLWPLARQSVLDAVAAADEVGCPRFRDIDHIKAEVHTWLAWQDRPGTPLGASINSRILNQDSDIAKRFLRWIGRLYGFAPLSSL